MSEPLGAEEALPRIRTEHQNCDELCDVALLLREVARLTEALEAAGQDQAESRRLMLNQEGIAAAAEVEADDWATQAAQWKARAERAEADLAAMTEFRDECERQYQAAIHAQGQAEADLADAVRERDEETAEIDRLLVALADEKRRRAGLVAGVEALICSNRGSSSKAKRRLVADMTALLDTATEETQGAP